MPAKTHQSQNGSPSRVRRKRSRRLREQEQSFSITPDSQHPITESNLQNSPLMRAEMVQQLQHQVGNRALASALKTQAPASIQRQLADENTGAGAALVGLKPGDGLDLGTEEARPRVSILQQKLNEKMMANIQVDGKFGTLTEEVLREFQESERLPIQSVVDSVTADRLMIVVEQPGGSWPRPSEVKYLVAGGLLIHAGNYLNTAGINTANAGHQLTTNEEITVSSGGTRLNEAGFKTILASIEILQAGTILKTGPGDAGVAEAGTHLQKASEALNDAAVKFTEAGAYLLPSERGSISSAGSNFMQFGPGLLVVAQHLNIAGTKMASHQSDNQRIGDPLVGLFAGDGINVGTWNRRPRVKLLQQKLNERFGSGLKVDGMFGPATGETLMAFQESVHLTPFQRVDPDTANALRGEQEGGESSIPGASEDLKEAGIKLKNIANLMLLAGAELTSTTDAKITLSGLSLNIAGSDFISSGDKLISSGNILTVGDPSAPGM